MPLLVLARTLFGLLSLAILGLAAWFLWSWYDGEWIILADGATERVRDNWRLATGLTLLLWSFAGRWIVPPFLARLDTGDESRPERGSGVQTPGPRGHMLYVEEHGPADGYPLILTHGWGLDSTIWRNVRLKLSSPFRVTTWDLPGLGRSPAPLSEVSLDAFADNLAFLVGQAGRPVVLVGHSIGGMTIQTLARNRPELFGREIAGVVLLNTTHTNPLRTMILSGLLTALRRPVIEPVMKLTILLQPLAWLSAWQSYLSGAAHMANRLGFGRYVTCSQLAHTTLLATRNPPGAQAKGNLAMFDWDAGSGLANLRVPVLVIGGDADIVTKLEASRFIAEAAPDASLEVVEGVNHMGFLERSDLYAIEISAFANRLKIAGATEPTGP